MNSLLLTGATGMLGSYIMRDALLARIPLTVLARPTGMQSAAKRIEAILQYWESELGRYLPRPKVIEGNLHESDLGLGEADRVWVAQNCKRVLHVAASVDFFGDERTGEPFRSNVEGTENLLNVCEQVGIESFHHVSTAYVGGRLRGAAYEVPVRVAEAEYRCAYEQSKAQAESLVRAADFKQPPTFFRPSIIVGDSQTGFAPAFQSIYTALRLGYLHLLANLRQGWELDSAFARRVVREQFVEQLGLTGDERKNMVPVDWVAAAIVRCVQDEQWHGQIYNLTNPVPISVEAMSEAMVEAVLECWKLKKDTSGAIPPELLNSEGFREQMGRYRVYFETDPTFDTSNSQGLLRESACPVLDHALLVKLWMAAVQADFAWRPPFPAAPKHLVEEQLEGLRGEMTQGDLQLQISGPGGGCWEIAFEGEVPSAAVQRQESRLSHRAYLSSETLSDLLEEKLTVEQSLCNGLVIVPYGDEGQQTCEHLQALLHWLRETPVPKSSPGSGVLETPIQQYSQAATHQDLPTHATNEFTEPSA